LELTIRIYIYVYVYIYINNLILGITGDEITVTKISLFSNFNLLYTEFNL